MIINSAVIGSGIGQKHIESMDGYKSFRVTKICELLDKLKPHKSSYKDLITFVEDRKGHDWRYAIDCKKISNHLGWQASNNFDAMLEDTLCFYLENK